MTRIIGWYIITFLFAAMVAISIRSMVRASNPNLDGMPLIFLSGVFGVLISWHLLRPEDD